MKYQFTEKDEDTTILKYQDKEFEIKRDVELQTKVQSVHSKARTKMFIELTKQGIKKEDLIIKEIKNGKTYEDNSNLQEVEKGYVEIETLNLMDEISKKYTNMTFSELIIDIGLSENNYEEIENFTKDFTLAIRGNNKTPSKSK
jgi:hypothetical protein